MKKIVFIVFLISVLLFNPYTMNRYIRPVFLKEELSESFAVEQKIGYTPDRYIESMGDQVVVYDGRNIRSFDEKGKELFVAAIRSDNFSVDLRDKNIYILDRVRKKVYSLNAQGEILAQAEIKETPLMLKALTDGRFALHYITDVKVEGLYLYDKQCKRLKEITYPKRSINFITEDEESDGFLVSSLIRDSSMLKNNIYLYDAKFEPTIATEVENAIFIKAGFSKNYMAFMDTAYVVVYDREFRPKCKIPAESGLRDIFLTETSLYTVDAAKKFRQYDLEGKLLKESTFKEDILSMQFYRGEPLIVFRGGYMFKDVYYDEVKDVLRMLPLSDRAVVVSKDSIRYVRIP